MLSVGRTEVNCRSPTVSVLKQVVYRSEHSLPARRSASKAVYRVLFRRQGRSGRNEGHRPTMNLESPVLISRPTEQAPQTPARLEDDYEPRFASFSKPRSQISSPNLKSPSGSSLPKSSASSTSVGHSSRGNDLKSLRDSANILRRLERGAEAARSRCCRQVGNRPDPASIVESRQDLISATIPGREPGAFPASRTRIESNLTPQYC